MIADRRLYLDRSQSRLVPEHSPECAWLLAAKGQEIPASVVARLDLVLVDGKVMQRSAVLAELSALGQEMQPEPIVHETWAAAHAEHVAEPEQRPIMPPESRRSRGRRK